MRNHPVETSRYSLTSHSVDGLGNTSLWGCFASVEAAKTAAPFIDDCLIVDTIRGYGVLTRQADGTNWVEINR